MRSTITRREMLQLATGGAAAILQPYAALASFASAPFPSRRPALLDRRFNSLAVESYLSAVSRKIGDPEIAWLFENCYPNTLDTTVELGSFEGKPDTTVITGDIPAMWLRDSSAQVWPYLALAAKDPALRRLFEGVIRRQARCMLIDAYAHAIIAGVETPPLEGSRTDATDMK